MFHARARHRICELLQIGVAEVQQTYGLSLAIQQIGPYLPTGRYRR